MKTRVYPDVVCRKALTDRTQRATLRTLRTEREVRTLLPMNPETVIKKLQTWTDQRIYVHIEVNPGAYWRSGEARLAQAHVKGRGPYRLFLELDDRKSLIQVDELTHMLVEDEMVICTGYDDHDRIARTIEISSTPFPI